ncbi:MAG: peptidoglycan DD-metalloendopeptidase family protein, partial [bacterium]|nr:peptidoglycan DD-metalloendopeptidase family protein [bacterium]
SSTKDPLHRYTSPGTYTVSLKVTNSFGNSNTKTLTRYITVRDQSSPYRLPFPKGTTMEISDGYSDGKHLNVYNDYYCVDFNILGNDDLGIPILAIADGVVTFAGWDGLYGFRVIINHGNGITSNYAHGSSINVNKGEYVKQGQELMVIWDTGNAFGPHLHFGMRKNNKSMELPKFSGCNNGCVFVPEEAKGYTSDNVPYYAGKIIEENQAEHSGQAFDGNKTTKGHNGKYGWKYAKAGTPTTTVTYRPRFSNKVTCKILVYIPPNNARTKTAKYTVKHLGD